MREKTEIQDDEEQGNDSTKTEEILTCHLPSHAANTAGPCLFDLEFYSPGNTVKVILS